jgi:hypothetical protein
MYDNVHEMSTFAGFCGQVSSQHDAFAILFLASTTLLLMNFYMPFLDATFTDIVRALLALTKTWTIDIRHRP